jgi:hypothetical protein
MRREGNVRRNAYQLKQKGEGQATIGVRCVLKRGPFNPDLVDATLVASSRVEGSAGALAHRSRSTPSAFVPLARGCGPRLQPANAYRIVRASFECATESFQTLLRRQGRQAQKV